MYNYSIYKSQNKDIFSHFWFIRNNKNNINNNIIIMTYRLLIL